MVSSLLGVQEGKFGIRRRFGILHAQFVRQNLEECYGEKRVRAQRGKKSIGIQVEHEEELISSNNLKVRGVLSFDGDLVSFDEKLMNW